MMERIQKIIAQAGICSRRKAEELIKKGKVKVNGRTAKIGEKAKKTDKITVNGKLIKAQEKRYYKFYKPRGYVTTTKEQHGMKTIMNIIKIKQRIFPTGRLDKDAEGLIILTNDGEIANKIMHPRYETKKEYVVYLNKKINKKDIEKLKKGLYVERRKIKPHQISIKGEKATITIHEGRKHIVKKIFKKLGYKVERLIRTKINKISINGLKPGQYKKLHKKEVKQLF
ncbi:pseudouridine synthase [Candidatus Woesearchaeota archaeon]|nr:MAG: pseudouridine synthase [Candidatus Woesearchaeota archaeon]